MSLNIRHPQMHKKCMFCSQSTSLVNFHRNSQMKKSENAGFFDMMISVWKSTENILIKEMLFLNNFSGNDDLPLFLLLKIRFSQ